MRAHIRAVRGEKGVALPLALFALLMLTGLLAAFLTMSGMEPSMAANLNDVVRARYVAEAGGGWAKPGQGNQWRRHPHRLRDVSRGDSSDPGGRAARADPAVRRRVHDARRPAGLARPPHPPPHPPPPPPPPPPTPQP